MSICRKRKHKHLQSANAPNKCTGTVLSVLQKCLEIANHLAVNSRPLVQWLKKHDFQRHCSKHVGYTVDDDRPIIDIQTQVHNSNILNDRREIQFTVTHAWQRWSMYWPRLCTVQKTGKN